MNRGSGVVKRADLSQKTGIWPVGTGRICPTRDGVAVRKKQKLKGNAGQKTARQDRTANGWLKCNSVLCLTAAYFRVFVATYTSYTGSRCCERFLFP